MSISIKNITHIQTITSFEYLKKHSVVFYLDNQTKEVIHFPFEYKLGNEVYNWRTEVEEKMELMIKQVGSELMSLI